MLVAKIPLYKLKNASNLSANGFIIAFSGSLRLKLLFCNWANNSIANRQIVDYFADNLQPIFASTLAQRPNGKQFWASPISY